MIDNQDSILFAVRVTTTVNVHCTENCCVMGVLLQICIN